LYRSTAAGQRCGAAREADAATTAFELAGSTAAAAAGLSRCQPTPIVFFFIDVVNREPAGDINYSGKAASRC